MHINRLEIRSPYNGCMSVVVAGSKPSRERVNGCVSGVASCHASTGMADFEGL